MMKKKMRFIQANSELRKWLIEKLTADPPKTPDAQEFSAALTEMEDDPELTIVLGTSAEPTRSDPDIITAGELEISRRNRTVKLSGRELTLTPKEFDILWFLAENRGEVFTKEQIYKAVWSENYLLDDSNIMAFIRKLRKKIEPDPDAPKYILTIWGIGYKFTDQM